MHLIRGETGQVTSWKIFQVPWQWPVINGEWHLLTLTLGKKMPNGDEPRESFAKMININLPDVGLEYTRRSKSCISFA